MLKFTEEKNIEIMCPQTAPWCTQWMHCALLGCITTLKEVFFSVSSKKNFWNCQYAPPFGPVDSKYAWRHVPIGGWFLKSILISAELFHWVDSEESDPHVTFQLFACLFLISMQFNWNKMIHLTCMSADICVMETD